MLPKLRREHLFLRTCSLEYAVVNLNRVIRAMDNHGLGSQLKVVSIIEKSNTNFFFYFFNLELRRLLVLLHFQVRKPKDSFFLFFSLSFCLSFGSGPKASGHQNPGTSPLSIYLCFSSLIVYFLLTKKKGYGYR